MIQVCLKQRSIARISSIGGLFLRLDSPGSIQRLIDNNDVIQYLTYFYQARLEGVLKLIKKCDQPHLLGYRLAKISHKNLMLSHISREKDCIISLVVSVFNFLPGIQNYFRKPKKRIFPTISNQYFQHLIHENYTYYEKMFEKSYLVCSYGTLAASMKKFHERNNSKNNYKLIVTNLAWQIGSVQKNRIDWNLEPISLKQFKSTMFQKFKWNAALKFKIIFFNSCQKLQVGFDF